MSDERPVDGDCCATCRCWIGEKRGDPSAVKRFGRCHANPPTPHENRETRAIWPKTNPDDWCARFERKRETDG